MTKLKCGAALLACAASAVLFASQTHTWSQGDYAEFEKGTIKNLSVRSDGLLSLAPHSREVMDTSSAYLWALTQDSKGNLYGTTLGGGEFCMEYGGCGVVFRVDRTGNETVLYNFCPNGWGKCTDGAFPQAGLIRDAAGNLYGTTSGGGAHGVGTVFKLCPTGAETVLYSFAGGADGANPFAGFIRDEAGNLYGTTTGGGPSGQGTVFKVDPAGSETVLYSFTGGTDGGYPEAGLIRDEKGNLYGTTFFGGLDSPFCSYFCGVVFKVDTTGLETVLYSFTGGADGLNPGAGLMLGKGGDLYGTTAYGGADSDPSCATGIGCGVVFKLTRR